MKMPNFVAVCLALLMATDVQALQLGQLTTGSRLGESLEARIELYATDAGEVTGFSYELRPEIGTRAGSPAYDTVNDITVAPRVDASGRPYLELSSSRPVLEPAVSFRLRVAAGGDVRIARYTLALEPQRYAAARTASPRSRTARSPGSETTFDYGPVEPGQSLWRILRETGLNTGDVDMTISDIVALNPDAFVGGDADRLRVGAMLSLPQTSGRARSLGSVIATAPANTVESVPTMPEIAPETVTATAIPPQAKTEAYRPPASAPIAAPAIEGVRTESLLELNPALRAELNALRQQDAEIAARLDALSMKFAAIRARYERGPATTPAAAAKTPPAPALAYAPPPAVEPVVEQTTSAVAPAPAKSPSASPADRAPSATLPRGWNSSTIIIVGVAVILGVIAMLTIVLFVRRRWRESSSHHHARVRDQALVAEIARKTEKRLQLEGEIAETLGRKKKRKVPSEEPAEATVDATAELREIDHRIAHGQYREAEALLRGVIERTPANYHAKLRLTEIYYIDKRQADFVVLAGELLREHRVDIGDEGWQRVVRMGKVIAPDAPMFSGPMAVDVQA